MQEIILQIISKFLLSQISMKLLNLERKKRTNKKNIVGKDINAELPKNPDILIRNNFSKSIKSLSDELYFKLKNFK